MAPAVGTGEPDLAANPALNSVVSTLGDALRALHQVEDAVAATAARRGRPVTAQLLLATVLVRYPAAVDWARVHGDVAPVICEYPSRVVAIVRDPLAARAPRPAQVGLITRQRRDGSVAVRGQLMVAALDGRAYAEAASLAASWSATEVPLVAWWNGPAPLDDHLFEHVLGLADRVVLESFGIVDCTAELVALVRLLQGRQPAQVSDLMWHRLQPWRQAVALMFDLPAHSRYLGRLQECTVTVGSGLGTCAAALLLAGWLGSRLDWKPASRRGDRWELRAGERSVALRVSAVPGDEAVQRIGLRGPDASFEASLTAQDQIVATARIEGEPATRSAVRRLLPARHCLLLDDLHLGGSDLPIYAEAARFASRLCTVGSSAPRQDKTP